jgi:CheY-like chemotaxis protein
MLASWHMKPTAVADSDLALAALRDAAGQSHPFDVVVADRQMPGVDGFMLARRIRRERALARTPIVMLMSVGDGADAVPKGVPVDAQLTKPVKHSDLLDAFATLFRMPTRRARADRAQPEERPQQRLRILVAEDNLVNRKLVTRLLQKRGHHVDAVENGRAAVAAVAAAPAPFHVLLMDLQMPEMSGFEATHAIRERERDSGVHLPIVALTAHAMAGDRERCLAAGMDGYLSKPIDVNELIATVERFGRGHANDVPPETPLTDAAVVFDEEAALAYAGGDRRLLNQVVDLFRSDSPLSFRKIDRALRSRDSEGLRMAAHSLKGAIATVGSPAGKKAAADLELMARSHQFADAEQVFGDLRELVGRLDEAFLAAGLVSRSGPRRVASRPRARRPRRSRS